MSAPRSPGRTREQILEAALAVVAGHGHAGMTMQRVADAAGVDKALLHYYFKNKAGLLAAVVAHLGDRLLLDVEEAVSQLDDPDAVVEVGFGTMWAHVIAEPQLHAVWLSLHAAAITDDELSAAVRQVRDRYRTMIAARITAMVAAGWRPAVSETALATLVLSAIDGFTVALLDGGRSPALDEAIATTYTTFRELLVRDAA